MKNSPHIIYDCIVIGLGIHGSSSLFHLSRAGLNVLGIEKFQLNHKFGSSHGKSRIFRKAYFEDPKYVPLLERSQILWEELNCFYESSTRKTSGLNNLFFKCGGIMIGDKESKIIQGTISSIKKHNLSHEILSSHQIKEKYSILNPNESQIGVYERDAGYLIPELCIETYLSKAESYGANLAFDESLISWEEDNISKELLIKTNERVYKTRKLVMAVGPWAPQVFGKSLPFRLEVERRVLYWTRVNEAARETCKNMPIFIWDAGEKGNFYGFPSLAGEDGIMKIACHENPKKTVQICTPELIYRGLKVDETQLIMDLVKPNIPSVTGEIVEYATCMYTMAPDGNFILDFHPDNSNVILLSACSGHGFKFGAVLGEIVKDLVISKSSDFDLSFFSIHNR